MLKVYLAGWTGETTYRMAVKQAYGNNRSFELRDPFDYHSKKSSIKEIVEGDKSLILDSDAVVAKVDRYSAGTMMEIIFAWTNNIPVYLISGNEIIKNDTWIVYHIEGKFGTFHECFEYLQVFSDKIKELPIIMKERKEYIMGTNNKSESEEEKESEEMVEPKIDPDIELKDDRYGMDDSKVATKLLDKNCSPMIIRKYTRLGFPLYVHLICDASLSDLDNVVHDAIDIARREGILENDIQKLRNFTGFLSDAINDHYDKKKRGCVESLGIIYYVDKMIISSLQGDCMNHDSCRRELYECLNLMTKI